ncbi:MAG: winged helix-turn-helix domain-containing protein [Blastocatellales bacterium]
MAENLRHLYEFGPFRLDVAERLLLRQGKVVPLTPKAFDLLLALLQQSGRLVEKGALLKAVWPDTFVEENNLADNISRLRKALGEGENGQKFIETVPKRGYRFVAEVKSQNVEKNESPVEESATTIGPREMLAMKTGVSLIPSRIKTTLRILALLVPVFAGVGLWLAFRLEKRSEIQQLEFKGNFYLGRWTEDEIRKGIEYYNRAIAMDANSASAYEGLADGWNFLSDLHLSPREAEPKAQAAVLKALQLDEGSAAAHVSLGLIKTQYDWDWTGAEREFKRALELEPNNSSPHQIYGWYLIAMGRLTEAQAEMKQALESDPSSDFALWGLGDSFYFARQYDQAVEPYRRAIAAEPRSHWTHLMLGWTYEQQGKFADAIAELKQAHRLNDIPQTLAALGHAFASAGQKAEAQKILAELQETAKRRYVSPYDLATVYAGLGEKEQALAWLEKAYEDRSGWLALWLKTDPKFDNLRSDWRFRDLLRRIGHIT